MSCRWALAIRSAGILSGSPHSRAIARQPSLLDLADTPQSSCQFQKLVGSPASISPSWGSCVAVAWGGRSCASRGGAFRSAAVSQAQSADEHCMLTAQCIFHTFCTPKHQMNNCKAITIKAVLVFFAHLKACQESQVLQVLLVVSPRPDVHVGSCQQGLKWRACNNPYSSNCKLGEVQPC